jgi:UDP-N-acetylglucosamine 4-epimerase
VPRSIADPLRTHVANVDGFVALALAARRANVGRVVYASSSSVYGDDPSLIKRESVIGRPLSPYAASKLASEVYARVYERTYGVTFVGLRYFNVFGPRQSPDGPYAAVIPLWLTRLTSGGQCEVFGDGSTSRDFCFIENVVNANLLAGLADLSGTQERIFNIACGESTSLLELHALLASAVRENCFVLNTAAPAFKPERPGDIRHSLADVSLAGRWLSYAPLIDVREGVRRTVEEYCRVLRSAQESCR